MYARPGATITVKESKKFQDLGFYLSRHGLIQNFTDEADQMMMGNVPWRGPRESTKASIKCSLRPSQGKETSLWTGRRAHVILAFLFKLQFKVDSSILKSRLTLSCL